MLCDAMLYSAISLDKYRIECHEQQSIENSISWVSKKSSAPKINLQMYQFAVWIFYLFIFGFHLQNEIQDFAEETRLTLYHRFLDRSTRRMSDLARQSDSWKVSYLKVFSRTIISRYIIKFKKVLRTLSWLDYSRVVQVCYVLLHP